MTAENHKIGILDVKIHDLKDHIDSVKARNRKQRNKTEMVIASLLSRQHTEGATSPF